MQPFQLIWTHFKTRFSEGLGTVKVQTAYYSTATSFLARGLLKANISSKGHLTRCLLLFKSLFFSIFHDDDITLKSSLLWVVIILHCDWHKLTSHRQSISCLSACWRHNVDSTEKYGASLVAWSLLMRGWKWAVNSEHKHTLFPVNAANSYTFYKTETEATGNIHKKDHVKPVPFYLCNWGVSCVAHNPQLMQVPSLTRHSDM